MAGNNRVIWTCPFFKWDEKDKIHGECGKLCFPSPEAKKEYAKQYCAGVWEQCTIAACIFKNYEKKTED